MTPPSLSFDANLPRSAFALKERITLSIVARNAGPAAAVIPDPFVGNGAALSLVLRPIGGAERRKSPADEPPPPGVPDDVGNALVLPGGEHTFVLDVADFFALSRPGSFGLVVEYTWAAGQTWRSGELQFSITPAAARFLDAVPTEAAGLGYHAILWVEPDGAGTRAILFDGGPFGPTLFGAQEVLAGLGPDAEPALSTAPAGLPQMDRWIAYIDGGALQIGFLSEGGALSLPPRATPLPAGHGAPLSASAPPPLATRIIRPLLAEDAPDEPRPRGAIGLLAPNVGGGSDFLLALVDRAGAASFAPAIALPGQVLGAWATAPSAWGGVFVLAIAAPQGIRMLGIAAPWGGVPGAPSELFTVQGDSLLLGDVRADLEGHVRIGLLVQRGARWARVMFTPPVADPAKDVITEDFAPGQGATAACARLDATGKLHVLYRQGGQLCYLPPGAIHPTWSSARLSAKASFEKLLLRPKHPRMLVYHDADEGASIEPI